MSKIYMVRGRKAGILTSHVFSSPPSDAQMKALVPEDEGAGWPRVHEAELLSASDMPAAKQAPEFSVSSSAGLPSIAMSATGVVKNPT
jgi:hypothetical protein